MQFKLVSVLALATAALASPVAVTEAAAVDAAAVEARAQQPTTGVYLCNDINFSGYCVHITDVKYNYCGSVNLSADLNDKVSSLGPDGSSYCLFYSAFNCNDSEGHFGTFGPGYKDLSTIGWNDKISSFLCYPN